MNSLRPSSVCDTTPLQRLESQSSCSEPSSPTLTVLCNTADSNSGGTITTATNTTKLVNHQNNNNNNIEVRLNSCLNCANGNGNSSSGNGSGISDVVIEAALYDKTKMMNSHGTRQIFSRIFLHLVIVSCVGLPILGFHYWGEAYQRGFFCDDESLKHPYKDSTVPSWMLYLMGFIVTSATITIIEFFIWNENKMKGFNNFSAERYYLWHMEVPDFMTECYKKIGGLFFGAGVGKLTTDIAKYSVGRLRPHFFTVCQPIMFDGTTCADAINAGRYIENFTCRGSGVSPKLLKETHLSFPSGHANFGFYTMIYIAIYLQTRMTWPRSKMFKHLLQFLFLMFAWYAALTRVSDYKHHWTDVIAGAGIGTLYAVIVTSSLW